MLIASFSKKSGYYSPTNGKMWMPGSSNHLCGNTDTQGTQTWGHERRRRQQYPVISLASLDQPAVPVWISPSFGLEKFCTHVWNEISPQNKRQIFASSKLYQERNAAIKIFETIWSAQLNLSGIGREKAPFFLIGFLFRNFIVLKTNSFNFTMPGHLMTQNGKLILIN